MTDGTELYWDPFSRAIWEDPYPVYRRLRDEAPAYHNTEHDFWAFARWEDVGWGLADLEHFSSSRGNILEFIQAGMEMPQGTVIFEDPPSHTINRGLVSRLFSPRAIADLEGAVRDYTVRQLETVADEQTWDLIEVVSDKVPMRVIGMLMGIPEEFQQEVRDQTVAHLRTDDAGDGRMDAENAMVDTAVFERFIDWRIENPANDVMTRLLTTEFVDAEGVTRRLTRDEVLLYCTVVSGAGNDTTGNVIGWMGKLLAEDRHQDVLRQLVEDPSLIPDAVEEVIRVEPVGHAVGRYVTREFERHGQVVPVGSAAVFLVGSAGRDERVWGENADRIDLARKAITRQRSFGVGAHYCLGANLARLECRVVLEELLKRYPRGWDVDLEGARIASTTTVRGWESLILTPRR